MTHSWHKSMYPTCKESWHGSATRKVFAAFFTDRWKMTPIITIALAPLAAWRRDPMVWGLVYMFLLELSGAVVLVLTILGSLTFNHLHALQIDEDRPAALAVWGLAVLIGSCVEYWRTGAHGEGVSNQ